MKLLEGQFTGKVEAEFILEDSKIEKVIDGEKQLKECLDLVFSQIKKEKTMIRVHLKQKTDNFPRQLNLVNIILSKPEEDTPAFLQYFA